MSMQAEVARKKERARRYRFATLPLAHIETLISSRYTQYFVTPRQLANSILTL